MRLSKLTAVVITCTSMLGCAVHPVYKVGEIQPTSDSSITIADKRPPEEKGSEILSGLITTCSYGIARMGDDKTEPDRMSYLRAALSQTLGNKLSGKTIDVKEFSIFRNNQVGLRGGVPMNNGFLTIAILNSVKCHATKAHLGGYDIEENPKGINAVIVNIVVKIDEKEFSARTVKPAPGTANHFPGTPEIWEKAVANALKESVDQLTNKISQGI